MYSAVRQLLFSIDAEKAHNISLGALSLAQKTHILPLFVDKIPSHPVNVWGLHFLNPVGLAAGLDKNGDYINALGQMGFGFLEIGTITPKPQPGNPKPRLFRLPEYDAIINRLGFNNKGVEHLVRQVNKQTYPGILGINIGKNKITPESEALADYQYCLERVYTIADYVTVNISSPNTPGLRDLQHGESLKILLEGLKNTQNRLSEQHQSYTPIAVKIAPDMNDEQLKDMAVLFKEFDIDGVIATNTTVDRDLVDNHPLAIETGGLSGKPVMKKSTDTLRKLRAELGSDTVIIGVGGVSSPEDANEKLAAGANLVQLYTSFIYQGPKLIHSIVSDLSS